MLIVVPGHQYLARGYDGGPDQLIKFMQRTGPGYPGNLESHGGTNCQELIRVLIDRVKYLQNQIGCGENNAIISHFRAGLYHFEARAADRHGKDLPHDVRIAGIENEQTCWACGHIRCTENHFNNLG